jgi:hypothetical protein
MLSSQKIRRYSSALSVALGIALFAGALSASAASGFVAGGGIEGEVAAEGGAPLAEVWACAYLAQSEEFEEHCDFTGSDGLYAIKGLKAGDYKIEFWSEATEPSYVGEFYDDKSFWEEAAEVEVKAGVATVGINAELAEGAMIEGEVRGLLARPVGNADAVVCATLPTGEPEGCALTRSDGTYALPGLPAGKYQVHFTPAFSSNLLNQSYDHKSDSVEADVLTVAAGETKMGIDADLEAGAEIHGTVYSAATGVPLPEVPVCALFYEAVLAMWFPRVCVPTSSTGGYRLYSLFMAPYKVVFSPEYKEFFGEDVSEHEDDGYFKQYFNNKPTLAEADLLALTPPEIRTGVDGHLQPEHSVTSLAAPIVPPAIVLPRHRHKIHLRCRPGFRKKKVGGKRRCVKVHKHRRHRSHVSS